MALRFTSMVAAVVAASFVLLAPPVAAQAPPGAARPQTTSDSGGRTMSQFLVHVHTGPNDPTKAALAFLVAATALKNGHKVDLFLAGDGVALLTREALASVEGVGTGRLMRPVRGWTAGLDFWLFEALNAAGNCRMPILRRAGREPDR
ncbi:hypothetical protein E2C05_23635, partial [Paracraurococcus ruber]